jgi:ribosome maturation factor RimP
MPIAQEKIDQVRFLAQSLTDAIHVELVDVSVQARQRDIYIEVLADRPKGGITIDECTWINKELNKKLEAENIFENYYLEVSSPGLDRPLKSRRDFVRVSGRLVRFFLSAPVNGKRELEGTIKDATDEVVIVQKGESEISIPMNLINKAIQVID